MPVTAIHYNKESNEEGHEGHIRHFGDILDEYGNPSTKSLDPKGKRDIIIPTDIAQKDYFEKHSEEVDNPRQKKIQFDNLTEQQQKEIWKSIEFVD